MQGYDWELPLLNQPIPVDWREVGGDWDRYLTAALRELTGGNTQGSSAAPSVEGVRPWKEYRVRKEPVFLEARILSLIHI